MRSTSNIEVLVGKASLGPSKVRKFAMASRLWRSDAVVASSQEASWRSDARMSPLSRPSLQAPVAKLSLVLPTSYLEAFDAAVHCK